MVVSNQLYKFCQKLCFILFFWLLWYAVVQCAKFWQKVSSSLSNFSQDHVLCRHSWHHRSTCWIIQGQQVEEKTILSGKLRQQPDLERSPQWSPGAETRWELGANRPEYVKQNSTILMKLMYIYLLLLITLFNEFWYLTMLPGMSSKISYQSVLKRFSYYVPKKYAEFGWFQSCANLPVNKDSNPLHFQVHWKSEVIR